MTPTFAKKIKEKYSFANFFCILHVPFFMQFELKEKTMLICSAAYSASKDIHIIVVRNFFYN